MAAIDYRYSPLLIVLFSVVLTSSVNAEPDDKSTEHLPDVQGLGSLGSQPPEVEYHSLNNEGSKNLSNIVRMHTEGGDISMSSTIRHSNIESTAVTASSNEFDGSKLNIPRERNASVLIIKKKIKPRKGVDDKDSERTNISVDQSSVSNIESNSEIKSNSALQTVYIDNKPETSKFTTSGMNVTIAQSKENSNYDTNSTNQENKTLNIVHTEIVNSAAKPKVFLHTEKLPKPKPTVTSVDGPEENDYRPLSHTKNSPLGISRKTDYIVPIGITVIALPLLGIVIYILYRRGRDCWDKRHYRRMDFLIDGMYND